MKKRALSIALWFFIVLLFAGCTTSEVTPGNDESAAAAAPPEAPVEQTAETTVPVEHTSETTDLSHVFVLNINNTLIPLRAWEHEVDMEALLGQPLSQEVVELGNGADTFSGSFIKKLRYDGIQFELFTPKQNGESFWIMTMEVSKEGFKTSEGIEVGDTVEDLQNAYPEIEMALDGRTDPNNCAYEISDEWKYNYLRFEVNEGQVQGIKFYCLIP